MLRKFCIHLKFSNDFALSSSKLIYKLTSKRRNWVRAIHFERTFDDKYLIPWNLEIPL